MANTCTICRHPDVDEINREIVRGETHTNIANEYKCSWQAIQRHKASGHIPQSLLKATEINDIATADSLLDQIEQYKTEIGEMKDEARAGGDIELALKAVDRALKCCELQSKVRGLIDKQPMVNVQVNILQSSEWIELRGQILRAIEPYPEAKRALISALPSN